MGIRTKIAIWFIILTISVISLVSFWGARSLGFTVDSSDIIRLQAIKSNITAQLSEQHKQLDKQANEISQALSAVNFKSTSKTSEFLNLINTIKEKLKLEYIEILTDNTTLLNQKKLSSIPKGSESLQRLDTTGPLSHHGYIISENRIPSDNSSKLVIAIRPDITTANNEIFCIFDNSGVLAANGFLSKYNIDQLKNINDLNSTQQITHNNELFRLRTFELSSNIYLITGYTTQVATLARSEINSMMIKLALLEIFGFLILGYFWGKRIFEPMKTLQKSIENVAQEKWQEIPEEVTENSYKEIGSVAKSFNQMVNQLSTARENLIEAQKKLATKDKMATLGRFSAGIAHEINNPLGTILMSAGLIKESLNNNIPIEHDDITTIIEEVKRCRDIIENLRTYTRKTKPNLIKYAFLTFMEEMRQAIISQFPNNINQITFTFSDDLNSFINVDKKAMQQVFNNLIKNAIEATENNLRIEISATSSKENCHIEIQDNGKGFECDPEHIFEPLFTTKAQGTGLGLVICQAIIDGHEGTIKADRNLDSNMTRFTIELPSIHINQEEENVEK